MGAETISKTFDNNNILTRLIATVMMEAEATSEALDYKADCFGRLHCSRVFFFTDFLF
jgi:hypothetical protein